MRYVGSVSEAERRFRWNDRLRVEGYVDVIGEVGAVKTFWGAVEPWARTCLAVMSRAF